MTQLFDRKARPFTAKEIISILSSDSPALDAYLGEAIYIKSDPSYLALQKKRFLDTVQRHLERVGNKPTYLLRAPGRLNAFLEYLDMCDGDHMSTTIDGDIPLAVSPREDDMLNLGNDNPAVPTRASLSIREELPASPRLHGRPRHRPGGQLGSSFAAFPALRARTRATGSITC